MTIATPIRRRTFLAAALASAAAAAAGCGFEGDDEPESPESNEGSSGASGAPAVGGTLRQAMIPVPHIDPAFGGSISARGNLIQTGLLEGLVVRDAENGENVLPGVAEEWTISDDLLVHTFSLRADAKWSNGDPVTADDFVWNWKRSLSPDTTMEGKNKTSANGSMKKVVGAAAFFGGSEKDFSTVGVKALDERTLEITLTTPDPLFMPTLAAWPTLPLHPATVEAHPTDWADPANWVGNGAFVLDSWTANSGATLVRNEQYWDIDSYTVDRWEIAFMDGGDTAQMVRYQANEIDTFMVEGDPSAITSDPELKEQMQTGAPSQFKGLTMMASQNPVLEDVRVRKALSLAIDRDAIAALAAPDVPGGTLIASGIPRFDEIPAAQFDPEQAKSLLSDAGYPDGEGMPTLQFLTFTPTPWVEAVGGMWNEHLGVQTSIDLVEVGVYGPKRKTVHGEDYVGFSYTYIGVTPPTLYKALNNVHQFAQFAMPADKAAHYQSVFADAEMNAADKAAELDRARHEDVFPEFKKYVDLVDQANEALTDPDTMNDLLVEAAIAREESYVAIPVLWAGYTFMVKPTVHELTVTSYPDQVFSLKGVTIDA